MRYMTAGESHGPQLTAIVEGVPAGLRVSEDAINANLKRRQSGYGRGGRQQIECDTARVVSGVRFGKTIGSPIALVVENRDWENWTERMAPFGEPPTDLKRETHPRPGHADLAGVLKNGFDDCRDVLERASARETAARVAAGSIALQLLADLGVSVSSYVVSIGQAKMTEGGSPFAMSEHNLSKVEASDVRCPDAAASEAMRAEIDRAREAGESLGGTFRVVAQGVVPGLGGYAAAGDRMTARLAAGLFSIPAIKGVEFGLGFEAARLPGSQVHDEIVLDPGLGFTRASNNAGGLEGGMTTGMPLVVTCAMKPIPTLMKPLQTVDLDTHNPVPASKERSDVCAVPACAIVAESEVAFALANAYLEKFGHDNMADVHVNLAAYKQRLEAASR